MTLPKRKTSNQYLELDYRTTDTLSPNPENARKHTRKQLAKLAASVKALGFNVPIAIDENNVILAGHARWEAARHLGLEEVPCIQLCHLSAAQKRAFALADNRLGEESVWDQDKLRLQLNELIAVDFDLDLTGFDTPEIDFCLDEGRATQGDATDAFEEPSPDQPAISRPGDLWRLGTHRLICGDALEEATYQALLGEERAQMVFADCPYNVPVNGHVSGLGRVRHREFAMASGEMSEREYDQFIDGYASHCTRFSAEGSIHFHCIDWRSADRLIAIGRRHYTELKNICVWAKPNAGMGSLYRSQHELVAVFKHGTTPHQNNVELGKHGRYRTNVWEYAGANSFGRNREADLKAHPTVKPVALVADAILDVTKRGWLVLDPFMGSGTTILAAQRTGRKAAGIEIDPLYVDTAIRRWQARTGERAVLDSDGRTFDEVAAERLIDPVAPSDTVEEADPA